MLQTSKIKEDPLRIAKNSDMLANAIGLLKEDKDQVIIIIYSQLMILQRNLQRYKTSKLKSFNYNHRLMIYNKKLLQNKKISIIIHLKLKNFKQKQISLKII